MPSDGYSNKPKILRGAFVEYGFSLPPLIVVFQFNPEQLSRSRSASFAAPGTDVFCPAPEGETEASLTRRTIRQQTSLRALHQQEFPDKDDLMAIQERQQVNVQEESISFDIMLDATDDLNDGNFIAERFGIGPRLATLELMMHPKNESLLGGLVDSLLGLDSGGFSFAQKDKPPITLFIWGYKRVLPVNITSMSITETAFSTVLDPIRAKVSVSLNVIEGKSIPYMYSKALLEANSLLNLANIAEVANIVVPG